MDFKTRAAKNWFIYFIQLFTMITFIIITFLKTEYRLLGSFLIIQMISKNSGCEKNWQWNITALYDLDQGTTAQGWKKVNVI